MANDQYGWQSYRNQLNPKQLESVDWVRQFINPAIKHAENDPGRYGVLSESGDPEKILNNSIINNLSRWIQYNQGTLSAGDTPKDKEGGAYPGIKFVDFMQKKWAPIGAENDPKNLNQNWAPNVRDKLMQLLGPEEYERWKKYRMVKLPWNNKEVA